MWLKQVGAPRSGFTCYKYPLKSRAIAVPIANKHRLQSLCTQKPSCSKSSTDMSGGKEEENDCFLNLGQSVHYLNPQMKFFLHFFRLFTEWISIRWGVGCEMILDIQDPEQRTTLCFEESFIICKETFNEVMKYKVKFLSVSQPVIV